MINETLKFLADELNKYLTAKTGLNTDPVLVVGNVAKVGDGDSQSAKAVVNKAILSLINVEEDRIGKQHENYTRTETGVIYKNPPVHLNLYVLFSLNRNEYDDSLKLLAHIIQFFQFQNVFTPISHPALDPKIQKLILDLFTLNFEQINHLWSTLGGKYMPSVMYKVRQVTINEDAVVAGGGLITEIETFGKSKLAVS